MGSTSGRVSLRQLSQSLIALDGGKRHLRLMCGSGAVVSSSSLLIR
jgi:hypothetical protein